MDYEIIFKPSAEKSFAKLAKPEQSRIIAAIEQLAINLRPNGVKKLKSLLNMYRIRAGEYRVIYSIEDAVLTVSVLKIGNFKNCRL